MTIISLIDKLQQLKDLHGNILVESRNPAGDFDEVCEVNVEQVPWLSNVVNYRVYLDT